MLVARTTVVFGLFGLAACLDPKFDASWKDKIVLLGAGMVRGAITWAQALQMPGPNRKVRGRERGRE
jgi:hypothetical protein